MTLKRSKGLLLAAGVLGSILAAATPALAQNHGGGGGHSSGGGGGGGHSGGGGGGHAPAGAHFGGGGHFSGPAHGGGGGHAYGGAHGYAPAYRGGGGSYSHPGYAGHPGYGGGHVGYTGRPGGYGGYHGYGYGYGHGYSSGTYWRGGYWRGGFWPRAYYGLGYSWFLPILPLAYATYWWGGTPYYYANDVYYTYSPDYSGYVATDPPPVNDSSEGTAASADDPAPSSGSAQVFMYPKNGQSQEQQAQDRSECQQWANQQAGSVAQNNADYNRAMVACVEGRGYSAR